MYSQPFPGFWSRILFKYAISHFWLPPQPTPSHGSTSGWHKSFQATLPIPTWPGKKTTLRVCPLPTASCTFSFQTSNHLHPPRSCPPTSLPSFLSLSFSLEHLLWICILAHHNRFCVLGFLPCSLLIFVRTFFWKPLQIPKFPEAALPVDGPAVASFTWGFRVSGMLPKTIFRRAKEDTCYALFLVLLNESIPPRSKLPRERYHALGGTGSDMSFVSDITCILQNSWHVLECKMQTWKILIFLTFSLPECDRPAEQTTIWKHVAFRIRYPAIWCDMICFPGPIAMYPNHLI